MARSIIVLLVVLLVSARVAHAGEAPTHQERYELPMLLVDAAAVTAFAIADKNDAGDLKWLAAGMYVLAGPVVHAFHHNEHAVGTSLALRATVPVLGALVGSFVGFASSPDSSVSAHNGFVVGVGVALAIVTLVDDLGHAKHRVADRAVMPTVSPTAHGVSVGLAGSF